MEIVVSGRTIPLCDRQFVAQGGQGRLYAVDDRVYKIYLDPAKVIDTGKLAELAALDHPHIVRPLEPVFDRAGVRIGFSMRKVPSCAAPLPQLFTSSFWDAHGVTPRKALEVAEAMRDTIAFIHARGFLQVDGNEFNYLVDLAAARPYFIDLDSYQTPRHPADAIMPSIRDYTRSAFSPETDWFSFAVVAFQLFTGIHPFKGRHPDFRKNDFEGRVRAGISVFHPAVTYPSSVRDFDLIPQAWRAWFEALFVHGERLPPPRTGAGAAATAPRTARVIRDGVKVEIRELARFGAPLRRCRAVNGQRLAFAGDQVRAGGHAYALPAGTAAVLLGPHGAPLFLGVRDCRLTVSDGAGGTPLVAALAAERVFAANNIGFVLHGEELIELRVEALAGRLTVTPGASRKVLPHALAVHDGLVIENLLGRTHLLPAVASGVMPVVPVPELDGERIVNARYERGVAAFLLADADGRYRHARLRFDATFSRYDCEFRDDLEELNFAVLDTGVMVTLVRDGLIEVAAATPDRGGVRVVEDPQIRAFMRLVNDGGRLACCADDALYALSLRA